MVHNWEPDTQYNAGSVVEYNGHRYKIIQPHRSQSDWAPSEATSAIWQRLKDSDTDGQYNNQNGYQKNQHQQQQFQEHQQCNEQPHPSDTHGFNPSQPVQQSSYGSHPSHQKAEISYQEQKKHWFGIDDKRKKELEIGGGLLAGAALLTGGYFAYKEHEENKEEKKARESWINNAKARTFDFHEKGPLSPATWILNEGTNIPPGAIEVGQEHDWNLYICRAFHEGGIQIGKASNVFKKGAVIGYKHEEIHLGTYEILVGDIRGLRWVDASGKLDVSSLRYEPVEGGHEDSGTRLYIAEARYNGVFHPGKASGELDGAYIAYDGTEKRVEQYRVLCYAK